VITGTLRRHAETFNGIAQGMGLKAEALAWPGLNEYDSEAVIGAIHPHKLEKPTSPEMYRHHFRLLRDGLSQWMAGVVSPRGMPSYDEFVHGVTSALDHVRANTMARMCWLSQAAGRSPPPWARCWARSPRPPSS
jgi:hypothetical protein